MINLLIFLALINPCYKGDIVEAKGYRRVLTTTISYWDYHTNSAHLNSRFVTTECQAVSSLTYLNTLKHWTTESVEVLHRKAKLNSMIAESCCLERE